MDLRGTWNGSDILEKMTSCLTILFLILLTAYGFASLSNVTVLKFMNTLGPLLMLSMFVGASILMVNREPLLVWTPLAWMFLAGTVYFGFGPLVYHFGSAETLDFCQKFYYVNEEKLLRTNILNTVGFSTILLGFIITYRCSSVRFKHFFRDKSVISPQVVSLLFLVIGLPVKYLLYMPYIFGSTREVLPQSIGQFQILTCLSIVPLMGLALSRKKSWILLLTLVILSEIFFAFAQFSKMSLLITLIMIVLAYFYYDGRIRVLIFGALVAILAFLVINPVIPYARGKITQISGNFYTADINERANIIKEFLSNEQDAGLKESFLKQRIWQRLNYADAQAFVMDRYDKGNPGNSFLSCLYSPIPRFLWPEKPKISDLGFDFCELFWGDRGSSVGMGIFAEAYWNGGYLLVLASALFVGAVFAVFSIYSCSKMATGNFIYLPVIYWGMWMGFKPDGWFAVDYFGVLLIAIATHFCISAFSWVYSTLSKDRADTTDTCL